MSLAACNPCAGLPSCTQAARVSVSGQIVDRGSPTEADRNALSGADIPQPTAAAGVRVEVSVAAGGAIDAARAVSTSDGSGWWQVSLPARAEGDVTADVTVGPPGSSGYTVHDVHLRATRVHGDGNVLGRWTRDLYLTLIGEVHDAPGGAPDVGARVTPVRRGGISVAPTVNTQASITTVGGGRFLYDVRPLADGPLMLDFVIERAGLAPATVPNVTVYPKHEWLPPNVDGAVIFYIDSAGHRTGQ